MVHFLVLNKVYAKASESGVRMLQMGMAVNKRMTLVNPLRESISMRLWRS